MERKAVLVDDHALLRNGLAGLVREPGYEVLFEADNGKEFTEKPDRDNLPDIVLLDIHTIHTMQEENSPAKAVSGLNERELEFLKLAATELTYKEIAEQMHLSPRTIDGYRDDLFEKRNIRCRVGLVLFAIKNGIVRL